ncbi:MAG: hypothetical protein SGARI_001663, partial [Bacillariaceae sp.]
LQKIETDLQNESSSHSGEEHPLTLAVVGGGASGIELALSIAGRLKPLLGSRSLHVRLVTSDPILLPEVPYARRRLKDILSDRGITMMFHSAVNRVEQNALYLESGLKVPFSYCIWATGAVPHDLSCVTLCERGLATNEEGWIQVEQTLQSPSHPNVFASGDCSSFSNPLPKAGVFALQEGPVLAENLDSFVRNRPPLLDFEPNMDDLWFLNCGDGTAIGFAYGLVLRGEWVYQVKLAMDQRHLLELTGDTTGSNSNTSNGRKHGSHDIASHRFNKDLLDEVGKIPTRDAAQMLTQIDMDNYQEAWAILERMSLDKDYRFAVMKDYNRMAAPQQYGSEKRRKKQHDSLPPPFTFLNWLMPKKSE